MGTTCPFSTSTCGGAATTRRGEVPSRQGLALRPLPLVAETSFIVNIDQSMYISYVIYVVLFV